MTAPEHHEPADLGMAQIRLDAAVHQLVMPTTEQIQRATAAQDPDVRDTDTEHAQHTAELRGRHAALLRAGRPAQARRVLARLIAHEQRAHARRAQQAELPSLLDQLQEAVAGTGGNNGAPGAGAHRSPIALGAAALLADIERTVRWGRLAHGDKPLAKTLHEQLRTWTGRSGHWRTTAPDYLLAAADHAERWVATARTTLTPPRPFGLAAACPVCGRRTAQAPDDTGEMVRKAALQVDSSGWARCIAPGCTGRWEPGRLSLLAAVLEDQAREARAHTDTRETS